MNYILLFVYGTLKKGYCNHIYLKGSEFVSTVTTSKKYLFLDNGIPYMVNHLNDDSVYVQGELYKVSQDILDAVDSLEGHPYFYKRKPIWVKNDKKHFFTFTYFLNDDTVKDNYKDHYIVIPNGEWK